MEGLIISSEKIRCLIFFSEAIMRHFILSEQITTPGLLRKHASLFLQKKSAFCSEEIMKLLDFFSNTRRY